LSLAEGKSGEKNETDPSSRLINRELSWLRFNERVLNEALNPAHPLLERLKFLAIFESNLDEFYMVRVSGLIDQFESGLMEVSPDGLSPNEQLQAISKTARRLLKNANEAWNEELEPALRKAGVNIRSYDDLSEKQHEELASYFQREIFPLCTPLAIYPASSIPFISNRSLNLLIELEDANGESRLARVKVPTVLPRAVRLPGRKFEFVLLEDVIAANLQALFPGVTIIGSYRFRVLRDADIEIRELEAADLIASIEETIRLRRFGDPVLLVVDSQMPERIQKLLMGLLELDPIDLFVAEGLMGFDVFWELAKIDKPALRFPPYHPFAPEALLTSRGIFEAINSGDFLVHHPYDSFRVVEEFVASASLDPDVIGIKQTLYRVGTESPIVESLSGAAEAGKQVAAMVELKARFDESNNLGWARAMERAGVHVTFGFSEMKTHCKLCLVVRREARGVRQYAHIGTGNYNPATARLYTDLGVFTNDPEITQDISELFNYLTGFSRQTHYRKLLVAPVNLREGVLELIHREIQLHKAKGNGRIILKLNAIVDPEAIEALYEASNAGVQIDLIVRGVCCLRPGVKGMSENIRVMSIVGRFLEHSRIYYFGNDGHAKVLIGSADLMRRNLDRRIEVLAPVERASLVKHLRWILDTCLTDNVQAWDLDDSGVYTRRIAPPGKAFSSQEEFMKAPLTQLQFSIDRRVAQRRKAATPGRRNLT
jgi:polyphosphate kinase